MRIKTAHKILIASAIVFFVFFGIWKFLDYAKTGETWTLVIGLASTLAAVGFALYLRTLRWREF